MISYWVPGATFCYSRDIDHTDIAFTEELEEYAPDDSISAGTYDDQLTPTGKVFKKRWRRLRTKPRTQVLTLRSWRKPGSCGGSCSRKNVSRRMERSMSTLRLTIRTSDTSTGIAG